MEDLIILLLFVAWIGYTFYKESEKQKKIREAKTATKPLGEPMQSENKNFVPQMEDTEFETEVLSQGSSDDFRPIMEKYSPEKVSAEHASPLEYIPLIDQINRPDFTSIEYNSKNISIPQENIEQPIEEDTFSEFSFDLKQAVIYSAILQRPYD